MLNLIINPDSIRKSSTQVFSEVYFQIDDSFFPEEKWDDFSVVILGWWLREACCIKPDSRSVFYFMDGPYYFEVYLFNDWCNINFISERYNIKEVLFSNKIKFRDFLDLLTTCANLLIRNLPVKANKLEDVLKLRNNFKQLQKYQKRMRRKGWV